jgi:replicative DNA helicase
MGKSNSIISLQKIHTDNAVKELFGTSWNAERAVIGSVLLDSENYFHLVDIVKASDFSNVVAAYIWHAFTELVAANKSIDYVTVSEVVPTLKGAAQCNLTQDTVLDACANMITSVPNIEHVIDYAHSVADNALRLRVVNAAVESIRVATDKTKPIDDVVSEVNTLTFDSTRRHNIKPTDLMTLASMHHDGIERGFTRENIRLVPSGFQTMDAIANGYLKGEVHIVAGGAGIGKSTWMLSQLLCMGKRVRGYNQRTGSRLRIVHFTMEMSSQDCIDKWVMQESGIPAWKLQRPAQMTPEDRKRYTDAIGNIATLPIEIVDEYSDLKPVDMKTRVKRYTQEFDVCMVTVDGLWLMTPDNVQKGQNLQPDQLIHMYLTMRVTEIARTFNVPIVMVHQYNQDAKTRGNKRPLLTDMKWGQAVQQDFHTIWGMHRLRGEDKTEAGDDDTVTFYGLKGRSNPAIEGSSFKLVFDPARNLYRDMNLDEVNQLT